MTQLYLFCWFGNELTLKSQELGRSIFKCNWTLFHIESVKSLLLISIRSTKPIVISCGCCITFTLDTFSKILKVSYTAFNVLRDSAYAEKLNEVLFPIILTQFTTSFSILCVTGYLLIKSSILETLRFISYVIAMLVEIFIYNWYANEVSTKFNLCISEINWTAMHVQSMKEITIMMIRSTSPIVFSCGSLIQLSLTSFMKILKISYSAINLLISS
ncbi:PREDICTED: odorant receptor 94a-like [Ceratosolen solmsi marchali]|uniref:Odorant receptor 94a-like n=1 Tax=Ceratosolen solmsi marchali TaxID=326594 RepID=A0AAJ6YP55_9HYME|nr:PREDICTED: odorant receptor 94a-like [Ceratosolen solmsi marchali]